MIRFPSEDEINTAVAWLRSNEGGDGECERCQAVAYWIEAMEQDHVIRSAARKAKVPVKLARRRIAGLR